MSMRIHSPIHLGIIAFHGAQRRHSVRPSDRIQLALQNTNSHAQPLGTHGSDALPPIAPHIVLFHKAQTGHAILTTNRINRVLQHGHANTRPTRASRLHVSRIPLVLERIIPLHTVQIGLAVVATYVINEK